MKTNNNFVHALYPLAQREIKNLFALTNELGFELSPSKKYHEKAKEAARKKTVIKEKNIHWVPIVTDESTVLVFGLKSNKKPEVEIELIEGLVEEVRYKEFLSDQLNKYFDPKSDFLKNLLEKKDITSFEQAIDKADIIGVNLRSPQAVILVHTPGFFKKIHSKCYRKSRPESNEIMALECDKVAKAINVGFKNYDQNIIGCLGPDLFVVLKWARGKINTLNTIKFFKDKALYIQEIAAKTTKTKVTIGTGQYYPGLSGLRKSYADAKIALDVGTKIWGVGRTYHITDVGMLVSLSSSVSYERKCELAHQIMGSVFNDPNTYKTIKVFLENDMNLTDASKKLHLHRNTLIYRLDKIKKEVGLDPRVFSDAVQLKLGIMLFGPATENCDD